MSIMKPHFFSSNIRRLSFFDKANRNWETAWQMNLTPWDLKGTIAPPLVDAIKSDIIDPQSKRALVPGCGSGYECFFLRESGFSTVTGLDLSKTAIDAANAQLQKYPKINDIQFEVADFFTYSSENYDFIFDYLFFAALDPPLREKWAISMRRLITPQTGILATLIFPLKQPHDDPSKGPPYPVTLEDYDKVLSKNNFQLVKLEKVINSLFISILCFNFYIFLHGGTFHQNVNSIKPRLGREMMAYWSLKRMD
jgi:SAM-dependent methyltransferase